MKQIYEYAMQMEKDGREFYLEQASKQEEPSLKRVLLELADDEQKHYNLFKGMRDGISIDSEISHGTNILSTVKNVFQEMKESNKEFVVPSDALKIWEHAREIEHKAETFYREKIDEVKDEGEKQNLKIIADEEHQHWVAMDNVVRFLNAPETWLEDAEWVDLDR